MRKYDKLIFQLSREGRKAYALPKLDVEEVKIDELIPAEYISDEELKLPEVSEVDIIRHYTNLANKNTE